jgi:hydrogenase nickel incorporation protein HypA/HybF
MRTIPRTWAISATAGEPGTLSATPWRKEESLHEFSICQGIIDAATAALERLPRPLPRVSRVSVRVGRLTAVVPATLRHCFQLLAPETALAGATLDVEEVPIRARCADCGARFEIEVLCFTCPECGCGLVELLSGRELDVVSLEADLEMARAG